VEWEPTSTVTGVCAKKRQDGGSKLDPPVAHKLTLELEDFAWKALEEEAARLGVAIEEVAHFAVLYYLADRDSGRISRRLPVPREPGEAHPLGKLLPS
jgi:hypothetical protein